MVWSVILCGLLLEANSVHLLQLTEEAVRGKFVYMDYLEGALLGPVWSDTDFENRTHKGAALLISVAFWAGFAYLLLSFYADTLSPWLQTPSMWLTVTLISVLVAPVLCYYYYDLPLLLRFVVLMFQAAKYVAAVLIVYSLVVPAISLNFDALLPNLLEWMDSTVGTFVERNTEVYELFGLLVSGIVLVLIGAIVLILSLAAIVLTPILYVQIVKYTQRLFDWLFLSVMKQIRRLQTRYRQQEQLRGNAAGAAIQRRPVSTATSPGSQTEVRNPSVRQPSEIRPSSEQRQAQTRQTNSSETRK